jgi:hypothetical protein
MLIGLLMVVSFAAGVKYESKSQNMMLPQEKLLPISMEPKDIDILHDNPPPSDLEEEALIPEGHREEYIPEIGSGEEFMPESVENMEADISPGAIPPSPIHTGEILPEAVVNIEQPIHDGVSTTPDPVIPVSPVAPVTETVPLHEEKIR